MIPAGAGDRMHLSSVTYKSIVAYDGTDYEGFQRQKQGVRTVQASLEAALFELGWKDQSILAAGRTDRGVHAEGQVIAYRLDWRHGLDDLTRALNAHLPSDIAIRESMVALPDFHPRFSAMSRCYRYSLFVDACRQPLRERYAMRLSQQPDMDQMMKAADLLVGKRDYRIFGPSPHPDGTTVRTIMRADWSSHGDHVRFEIEADAFLQHMVRRIVAAMLEIGLGRMTPDDFRGLLEQANARWQGALAPSCGLCLISVSYPSDHGTRQG